VPLNEQYAGCSAIYICAFFAFFRSAQLFDALCWYVFRIPVVKRFTRVQRL